MDSRKFEDVDMNDTFAVLTPLELLFGFESAEDAYDRLSLPEQLIVDLLCAGYTHGEIGGVFGVSQPSITARVRRIRFKLADSKIRVALDARIHYRDETQYHDGYRRENNHNHT